MLQTIEGRLMYVVDFDTMPVLPIKGDGWEQLYADALTQAIEMGIIDQPGKYGIYLDVISTPLRWNVAKIIE